MAITIQDFITDLDSKFANAFSDADKLSWVNDVNQNDYSDIVKEYANHYYTRAVNVDEFTLPSGVSFTDISKVYVDGILYRKHDIRAERKYNSFYLENGKLKIYPIPTVNDVKRVYDEITFETNSLTADGLTGFKTGDIVSVNDITARVLSTSGNTLYFTDDTFTEGTETDVTISIPKIRVVCQSQPVMNLMENIATDTLLLPDRFMNIYTFYCMAQIALFNRDFEEYNNYMLLYQKRFDEFETWWEDNRPQKPDDELVSREYDRPSRGFDYC